nr:bifunctional hydroxymethylpyrimidine kinase/phosphomethylpyrimidine kinase [Halovivax gelatinilyticus]
MTRPTPVSPPVALSIAGSDSGGGAGIQADLGSFAAHGVFGTTAITAVTAQHTRGVESSFVLPTDEVAAQIDAVVSDFEVGAAKTGMLATAELVSLVAARAADASFPLVVDPVMVATSGDRLLDRVAEEAYEAVIAEAAVVTPNADEAEVLTGIEIGDVDAAREAGRTLLDMGADAALVKGGHVPGETVVDVLVVDRDSPYADGESVDGEPSGRALVTTIEHPRVETDATHGSGCALSAAIAARLARGESLTEAVEGATDFIARAISRPYDVGRGPGAVNPSADVDRGE